MSPRIKPGPRILPSKRLRLRSSQTDHQIVAMLESSGIWRILLLRALDSHKDCTAGVALRVVKFGSREASRL